ncbi:phosphatase PAP2 family protein [Sphingomonas flavescens]|uniref:phosphatase PAP2 family protein n=1 Tax=Sphingomonas flavescens TaxID=3132797 RepID=UPI0028040D49|nr:phosphatase PAP2 family protein [Sphingomonas limnosediminicola]
MLFRSETKLLILLALVAVGLLAFLQIATEVREGETLTMDRAILLWLRSPGQPGTPIGPQWLLKAMTEITALGGGTVLTLLTVLVGAYLLAARRPGTAAFVVVAVAGGAILSTFLKHIFERPRPELVAHLVSVNSASFPSGHAMNSAVTYLTLGTLLAEAEDSRRVRYYLIGTAIFLSILVGVSRIYLGVHWPTDVAAGWCIGSVWALVCSVSAHFLSRRHTLDISRSGD